MGPDRGRHDPLQPCSGSPFKISSGCLARHRIGAAETEGPVGSEMDRVISRVIMRLLIIEDDRDAADYLAKAFCEAGHIADLASDGQEGLRQALDGHYAVLMLDRMR